MNWDPRKRLSLPTMPTFAALERLKALDDCHSGCRSHPVQVRPHLGATEALSLA